MYYNVKSWVIKLTFKKVCGITSPMQTESSCWMRIYRSPSSTEANTLELDNFIENEHVNTFDNVYIVGDFSFPTIKGDV